MKKHTCTLFILLSLSFSIIAAPFGDPHRPGPGPASPRDNAPLTILPPAAELIVIGGLTYYLLNGLYYQKQDGRYVVVDRPSGGAMSVLDYNGKRYYVKDGHYYQRNIDDEYIEVPRPAGL
ncbi:DUF6515 family protein [Kosakonia radicincitans]|uniref:DUF6515 family protein n=1 Tax=Kosakonia radicincitans TaxID=283686 RepID=UPI0005C30A2F|nr:DUF6515 family protein [Kosakonia radicincitans]KIS42416.1 hypothetical protein LG58_50 [Kosakonia radicincitans YD4]